MQVTSANPKITREDVGRWALEREISESFPGRRDITDDRCCMFNFMSGEGTKEEPAETYVE